MDDLALSYAEMGGFPIDHGETPIRLFKSDFLEFFTHISPVTVALVWAPVIAVLLIQSAIHPAGSRFPVYLPGGVLIGLFLWTLIEYLGHRFIFHYHPRSITGKKISFLAHGIHHAQPQCKSRLVLPLAISIPPAVLIYGLFYLVIGKWLGAPVWVKPIMAGILTGYLAYDLTHYATHHFRMTTGVFKFLKRYHMMHHFKTPTQRFGVSSPLWDVVFGTMPEN
jgi:sterol desaturase/sphingolipid hydroxylase (fatty acid hydroxylase superfamily)